MDFEIIIGIGVLTTYTMVQVLKNSTAFVRSFVVSNSSKHLTRGLPNVGDSLTYRAGILIYDIRIKYFKTLAFNFLSIQKISWWYMLALFLYCVFQKQFLFVFEITQVS